MVEVLAWKTGLELWDSRRRRLFASTRKKARDGEYRVYSGCVDENVVGKRMKCQKGNRGKIMNSRRQREKFCHPETYTRTRRPESLVESDGCG
jgi:hypothetical protein